MNKLHKTSFTVIFSDISSLSPLDFWLFYREIISNINSDLAILSIHIWVDLQTAPEKFCHISFSYLPFLFRELADFFLYLLGQIVLDRQKGMALVLYDEIECAQTAVQETKGRKIGGNRIKVSIREFMGIPFTLINLLFRSVFQHR